MVEPARVATAWSQTATNASEAPQAHSDGDDP
jgi:hypothetical protein